jgi:hypothetical protein
MFRRVYWHLHRLSPDHKHNHIRHKHIFSFSHSFVFF